MPGLLGLLAAKVSRGETATNNDRPRGRNDTKGRDSGQSQRACLARLNVGFCRLTGREAESYARQNASGRKTRGRNWPTTSCRASRTERAPASRPRPRRFSKAPLEYASS